MATIETAITLLIFVPLIGAIACLVGQRKILKQVTIMTAVATAVISLILFIEIAGQGFIDTRIFLPDDLGYLVEIFGAIVALTFLYLGWRTRSILVIAFSIGQLAVLSTILLTPGSETSFFLIDTLALIMVMITSIIGSIIALYSLTYMRNDPRRGVFLAVILAFLGIMNAAAISNDIRWFDVFWSITTLFSFLLIGHTRTDDARAAARLALIINTGGGLALLLGARLMMHYHETYLFTDLPIGNMTGLVLLPLAFISIGAFTKSAQLPFQSWLLDAMVAPTPVSALLHSSTMVNLGVFLVLRITPSLQGETFFSIFIALIGGLSFLITSILAMTQSNAKRILAYSTVGNLGLIFMCAGIGTPLALAAAVILLLYHAISKALLFLAVGVVQEGKMSEDIEDMYSLRRDMPLVTLSIFIGIATLVLPPFGMFVSKWLISETTTTFPLLAFLLAVGFASMVVYYFKWLGILLTSFTGTRRPLREDVSPQSYRWILGALSAGAVAISALVGPITHYLISPFVAMEYELPGLTESLSIFTVEGEVQALLILFLVVLAILIISLFRRRSRDVTVPYGGGEEVIFQAGGSYYLSNELVTKITRIGNLIGATLIVILVIIPLIMEVF
ncbi:MAG: hypothetical protein GX369_07620 [Euryarchaeota archaeon]|nr:hypothetical protein [Euryarchaeota archaeon]